MSDKSRREKEKFNSRMKLMGRTRDLGWIKGWNSGAKNLEFIFFTRTIMEIRA